MKKHLPLFLTLLIASFSLGAFVAHAAGYVPLAPLGDGITASTLNNDSTLIATYLGAALKLIIALGGALAILMAIIAGTKYVAAGISPDAKSNAKSDITNALIGLALILSSYLILNSIDPNLVKLNNFTLAPITVSTSTPIYTIPGVDSQCHVPSLTPLTGLALRMENGEKVLWAVDSGVAGADSINSNLTKMKTEVDSLLQSLSVNGYSGVVTSAYRPMEYQQHLYDIYIRWFGTGSTRGLKDMIVSSDPNQVSYPECAEIRAIYEAEYNKHGLLGLVASPIASAPHMQGTGVDIVLNGIEYTRIDDFMTARSIKLDWQNAPNDIVHFNYSATGPKQN